MMACDFQGAFLFRKIFAKAALSCLAIYMVSSSGFMMAMEGIEAPRPTDRLEFAFVLLPDGSISKDIQKLAAEAARKVAALEKVPLNPERGGGYSDRTVNLPHVSIGQYGILGAEYSLLTDIAFQASRKFKPLAEPVSRNLSVTKENIFLDFQHIRENTNPVIRDIYAELRDQFMNEAKTKFPIVQALLERFKNKDDPEEIALIDQCYQNWGTPEQNRIRPHFTLLYNYAHSESAVKEALVDVTLPSSLETITFDMLGIVQIDIWGNPERLLYATRLGA